jgi:membrane protease subunit HflK
MPWNPSDPNKDPWGRDKNKSQGPPDLDALLREYKNKLAALFGGKKSTSGGGAAFGSGGGNVKASGFLVGLVVVVILILWALSGIFIISPAERGVVQRFGRYVETVGSGPHWIPRFVESKQVVNVQQVSTYSYQSEMLTKDENIVSVAVTVQYRIMDAKNFLFNVVDPVTSLEQATASALRQAVGHNTLDDLLTTGRAKVREQVAQQLQEILDSYKSGLVLTDVTLQAIKPPEEVTAAFDDAIKAREDEQAYINKAQAYSTQVLAEAQGRAARIVKEAEAYRKEVVLDAQGGTASYLALLPEYHKAPEVTKDRLYLSAMESVLSNTSKIFLDQKQGNPILYLPLDKMVPQTQPSPSSATQGTAQQPAASATKYEQPQTILEGRASYPSRGNNE